MGGSGGWSIAHLVDQPALMPRLADWYLETWEPYYGANGPGDARADLGACRHRDRLPICLVALDAGGNLLGTAALRATSMPSHPDLGPWLAALLVTPSERHQGVADYLVSAIEDNARQLGFHDLYCGVDAERTLLARRGWREIDRGPSLRGEIAVYRLGLETG